ncbi:MAG: TonB-dependent receptor [Alphaproteobacteria bacterium]|jgi:vitamin B12 transporter|nr:TonB-dependent receptor [Alphaproteobacteria bacterium]
MKFFYYVIIALLALPLQPIFAEENGNDGIQANESFEDYQLRMNKSIKATLPPTVIKQNRRESSNGVYIITREMIANSGSLSVADILQQAPSVFINSNGDFGQSATVSLNGGLPQHIVILLNGVRLGDPSNPQPFFDIGQIPLSFIEEIEIIKGASTVLYGSGAIAGVINIKTIKYQENIASLKQEFGSRNTLTTQAGLNASIENFNVTIFGNFFRTDGYSIVATPQPDQKPENDKSKVQDINLRLTYDFSTNTYIDSFFKIANSRADYDGFDKIPLDASGNYVDKKENLYYLLYNFTAFEGFINQLKFSQYMANKRYFEVVDSKADEYLFSSKEQIFSYKGNYSNSFINFTGGFDFESKHMDNMPQSTNDFAFYGNSRENLTKSFSLEQGLRFNQNQKNLSMQDTHFTDNYAYNLGAVYNITTDSAMRFNYGVGYRLPSLYELFSDYYGNSDLKPESSQGVNLEFSSNNFSTHIQRFQFNAFYTDISNMIFFNTNKYENIGNYTTMGFDVSFPFYIEDFFSTKLRILPSYTYTNTRDSNKNNTTIIPKSKVGVNFDMDITQRYNLSWVSYWASSTTSYLNNTAYSLPSYWVNNAMISRSFSDSSKLYFRVDNVFNKQYQTNYGYNTKDRSYYFGLVINM